MITNKKKVLIIDDEPSICEFCRRVLSDFEHHIMCSDNGQEGWRQVLSGEYDAVLLDIRLPLTSGKTVFRELKKERPELADRILLTSGDLMNEDTAEFIQNSGRPFLPKPFTPQELRNAISQILSVPK